MTQAYDKLKGLLEELFQFDRRDLDFGIYRIMNHKRNEVLQFLDHDLLPQVEQVFGEHQAGEAAQIRERMDTIEEEAARYNADPTANEEYRDLEARFSKVRDITALENEVYSDLYTFFRRYYKNGDFLSLRRYKPGVYAVPYEGQEIKLHWANADQYYVKTAENFRSYRFELEGVGHVNFELLAATTERDNNKPTNGKERRFVLREEEPVEEREGELHVYFEYRLHPDKQKDLSQKALVRIFENVSGEWKTGLAELVPTQSNKDRTQLEKHLTEYTARNTFDYFIHKDLGGFLRRELDFFLKSEVLHIDDLDTENERRVEQYLSKLKVIKRIGYKIIAFLAQIEDFQKKLFLKKKFVVRSDYCLTLDNVSEDLYEEIAVNDAQYAEWEERFAITGIEDNLENGGDQRSVEWLRANPYLVLDTKFFGQDFKGRLLASIEDLDEQTDGLLINGENFQALNLLQARYRERVKCIYIDPPYNTGNDEFLYKDQYLHSSWLSMLQDRSHLARRFMSKDSGFFIQIGDEEAANLKKLLDQSFGTNNFRNAVIVRRGIKNVQSQFENISALSVGHDTIYLFTRDENARLPKLRQILEEGEPGKWDTFWRGTDRRTMRYELFNIRPETGQWRWSEGRAQKAAADYENYLQEWSDSLTLDEYYLNKLKEGDDLDFVRKNGDGVVQYYVPPRNYKLLSDVWLDVPTRGSFTEFPTEKNVALLRLISNWVTGPRDSILDFFAGSGTTGHAIIDLNREDGGKRKYILVDMGTYFDSVLKPRILKAIYSKDWRDGRPVSREGTSHIFKCIALESYEDTLNNLSLHRTGVQEDLIESNPALREEYTLSYMLDFETRDSLSLLNLDAFVDPFSYKLNITRDDETRPENVDLVETFNYLLGLTVSRTYSRDGYRVVEGANPAGERTLVIWRNTRETTNKGFDAFFEEQGFAGDGFHRVYANGDNTLAIKAGDSKVRLIEEEFRRLMFDTEGV